MSPPLATWHAALGAELVDDRGVTVPAWFSDPASEYAAVRNHAGLIDLSFRGQLRATGADRASFLHGMLSNDIKRLQVGSGCAAAMLTEQARIVADLRVYACPSEFILDFDLRAKDKLLSALDRFLIADDVEFTDLSTQQTAIGLQGPLADRVLAAAGVSRPPVDPYQHVEISLGDDAARLIRVSDTGYDGYELWVSSARVELIWQLLMARGAPLGLQPVGYTALNVLRIEAGIPWYGLELDETRLVLEARLEHAISLAKGCYLGQEVVERVTSRGRVNRALCGLLVRADGPVQIGAKLFHDTREVGWITSVADSPRLGQSVALAYIRREHQAAGTELHVSGPLSSSVAEVSPLPFL